MNSTQTITRSVETPARTAAGEVMPISRRKALGLLAAVAVPPTAVVAVAAASPVGEAAENPDLVAAYQRFVTAQAELVSAKGALEWLADEWRHLWPLAPEEILNNANADEYTSNAERDIAGRLIVRDTADLTQRLTRKWREEMPTTVFTLYTAESVRDTIDFWLVPRTARTPKALARKEIEQTRVIAQCRDRLRIIEEYNAETARIREASGVELVKQRVKKAQAAFNRACIDVSHEPAYTFGGLIQKGEVLQAQDDGLVVYLRSKGGSLGGMARFIEDTLAIIGRASA